jgi:hypothetical protein
MKLPWRQRGPRRLVCSSLMTQQCRRFLNTLSWRMAWAHCACSQTGPDGGMGHQPTMRLHVRTHAGTGSPPMVINWFGARQLRRAYRCICIGVLHMVPIFSEYVTFHPHPGFSIIDQISCTYFRNLHGQEDPKLSNKFLGSVQTKLWPSVNHRGRRHGPEVATLRFIMKCSVGKKGVNVTYTSLNMSEASSP